MTMTMTMTMADMTDRAEGDDRAPHPAAARGRRRRSGGSSRLAYKRRIMARYDALSDPAERGALLRREGLYHSHLRTEQLNSRSNKCRPARGSRRAAFPFLTASRRRYVE